MALGMAKKPSRSSSPESINFTMGSSVEVRSSDIGFQGAWYEATIFRTPRLNYPRYHVKYSTLVYEDSNAPLRESVHTTFVRPRYPLETHYNDVFGLHQIVEAFHNEGWWSGVVSKLPRNCDGLYSVCFPTSREEFEFKASELRRMLKWVNDKWVSVEDSIFDDKEGGHVMFSEGTRVEVSRDRENYGAAWFVGTVVKFIGRTYFLVEYENIKVDTENSTKASLREIVDLQYIRPCPPVSESTSFNLMDEVEVFWEDGWHSGLVSVILPESRYIIKYKHKEDDMEVHHTSLRPHLVWTDGHWVHISEDNGKEVADVRDISSRSLKKERVDECCSWPLETMKKKKRKLPEEHSKSVGEIKSDTQTSKKWKSHAGKQSACVVQEVREDRSKSVGEIKSDIQTRRKLKSHAGKQSACVVQEVREDRSKSVGEIKSDIQTRRKLKSLSGEQPACVLQEVSEERSKSVGETKSDIRTSRKRKSHTGKRSACDVKKVREITNKKVRQPNFEEDGSSQLCTTDGNSPTNYGISLPDNQNDNMETEPLIPTAKLPEPSIEHTVHDHSDPILSGSRSDKLREIQMLCDGSSLNMVDTFSNDHSDQHELVPSLLPLVSCTFANGGERENTVIAAHSRKDPPNLEDRETALKMMLPLDRISEMSELVKFALDVFPQQPHFRPLLKHGKELREGLACGLTMAFASLVTGLSNMHVLDSEQEFEEKLKVLDSLEKHGFAIQPVRARLEKLLEIRNVFGQLEEKKNKVGMQVQQLKEERGKDGLLLSKLEKSVVELEERLACVREERSSVVLKMEKNESEIDDLKARARAAEEKRVCTERQFIASAIAPW